MLKDDYMETSRGIRRPLSETWRTPKGMWQKKRARTSIDHENQSGRGFQEKALKKQKQRQRQGDFCEFKASQG